MDPVKRLRAAAIHDLIRGGWNPPTPTTEQAHRIVDDIVAIHPMSTIDLTARETRILRLVADGLTSPQIAARLGRAPATITSQLKVIRRKMGARNLPHAVAIAYRQGLID